MKQTRTVRKKPRSVTRIRRRTHSKEHTEAKHTILISRAGLQCIG